MAYPYGFNLLHLLYAKPSVARDDNLARKLRSETAKGLLVHLASTDVGEIANVNDFASTTTTKRNTDKAVEARREVVDHLLRFGVEIARTVYGMSAYTIVDQYVIVFRTIAIDAL